MDLFQPGTPILLQINSGPGDRKYQGLILGYEKGKYFIVRIPSSYQRSIMSGTNPLVSHIVSLTSKGFAYKFETKALAFSLKFIPILFLKYPEETQILRVPFRQFQRIETLSPVSLTLLEDDLEPPVKLYNCPDVIVDLSEGGCLISCSTAYPQDTLLTLTFRLQNGEKVSIEKGIVKDSQVKSEHVLIRVMFFDVNPRDQAILKQFLELMLSYNQLLLPNI